MKPRSCWSVLTKKAKDEEEVAQTACARARNKVLELQQSRQRMNDLLEDYKQRALAAQSQLQTMAQATNSRQFLLQLQNLVDRVDTDLKVALRELEQAKAVLLQATHQRMKMETMQEKDLHAVQQWERQRDQKDMDSLGLTLYNLKA
ncbi:MAG: flagellar export protein FliJ [Limnohabitans sp.]|mgnify:FL=1|jgi:flagellar export protein FliJ|nr:flagellar FliJ family protein [Burkholderiales bacterium]MCE2678715.1 flagellar FliJ family protein [Burkholderiaceae bacterium]